MSFVIYRKDKIEPEMGFIGCQNFLMAQAHSANERNKSVTRVWSGEGKSRVLVEVIVKG